MDLGIDPSLYARLVRCHAGLGVSTQVGVAHLRIGVPTHFGVRFRSIRPHRGTGSRVSFVGPVSYTHLDVYKRQSQDSRASAYRMLATMIKQPAGSFKVTPPPEPSTELTAEDQLVDQALKSCLLYTSRCV